MAITASNPTVREALGKEFYVEVQVTGDSSYPAGGYDITPSLFGFNAFANAPLQSAPPTPAWQVVHQNNTAFVPVNTLGNQKLMLWQWATAAEVTTATNVSTFKAVIGALGH